MDDDLLQIGEVAQLVGLSLRTIRHYEDVGVVVPSGRSTGGFRLYRPAEVHRLRLVTYLKPLDFSLEEMRNLLDTLDAITQEEGPVRQELIDRIAMFTALAEGRCERLRELLTSAEALIAELRGAVANGPPSGRR